MAFSASSLCLLLRISPPLSIGSDEKGDRQGDRGGEGRGEGGRLDLVGEEQADALQALGAAVDIIPEEEVVCFGGETTVLEQAHCAGGENVREQ